MLTKVIKNSLLRYPIKHLLFFLALASSLFPRPLDFRFLVSFILVFVILNWREIPRLLSESLKVKSFFSSFLLLLIIFTISHGWSNTLDTILESGFATFVPAFLFFGLFFRSIEKSELKTLLVIFYSIVTFISIITILQFFGVLSNTKYSVAEMFKYAPIYRSTAFFPHSTANTLWLMSINLILLYIPFLNQRHFFIHNAVTFISVFALSATQGRAGFVICFFAALIVLVSKLFKPSYNQINLRSILKPAFIFLTIFACIIAVWFLGSLSTANRFSEFFNAKAKHNQRIQENYLGKEILLKYPLGAGSDKIAEAAALIRSEDPFLKDNAWIFTEWHGIHNGFLHYASIWGWPGLICVIFCVGAPFFLRQKKQSLLLFSFCLAAYSLTDNIFYREVSSIFAFAFLNLQYLNTLQIDSAPNDERQKKLSILSLILFLLFSILSTFLVPLRLKQINTAETYSLAIDNPSSEKFQIYINQNFFRELAQDEFVTLFFNSDSYKEITLQSSTVKRSIVLDLRHLQNHSGLWMTTNADKNYFYLFYKNDSASEPKLTSPNDFTLYPLDDFALNIENFIVEEKGNRLKNTANLLFRSKIIQDKFMRDSNYRCYEPSQFDSRIGLYSNPCLISSDRNYRTGAIKQVFGF